MQILTNTDIETVSGGNPLLLYAVNLVIGGLVWDGIKEGYNQLSNTPRRTSSGGNMQRGYSVLIRER